MKSDKSTPNVPTLRFKSFEQEWEYSTIGKCSISLEYGMNAAAVKYDGKHKYIRITDIDEETSAFIPNPLSSPDGEFEQRYLVKENDILFARTGASVGKSYLYNHNDGELYFAGFLIRARIKPEYNGTFIYYQTKSKKYDRWVKLTSMRSGQPGINSQEYSDYSIAITGKVEQDKIADFFQMLDNRIAVQNKIISKYESLIKGLCEYIIKIANGHPIRLGEISTIYQPQTITQAELSENGDYPVFGANGIIGYYHQFNHEKAQIIITCRGSTCGTVNMSAPNSWITGNSMVVNVDGYEGIVDKLYLFYYLKTISFKSMISGSGQPQIVRKPLVDLLISLPELNTQVKYRSIIDTIDKKLVKEKDMLFRLTDLKAYLLSNLFI